MTPGIFFNSSMSATVSVTAPPCPVLTPLTVIAPGKMMMTLVPKEAIWACTAAFAPSPMLTIAMTAPTPMMMPNIVKAERMRCRPSTRNATRTVISRKFMPASPAGRGARRVAPRDAAARCKSHDRLCDPLRHW